MPKNRTLKSLIREADTLFSLYIRKRDKKCIRCGGTKNLQCSHFWSRKFFPVRYDFRNSDAACAGCHKFFLEVNKQGWYMDFKVKQLGKREYNKLRKLAESPNYKKPYVIEALWKLKNL